MKNLVITVIIQVYYCVQKINQQTTKTDTSVQQPQSSPTFQMQVDAYSQPLTFSKHMGNEQLALWLRNHPSLSGTNYEEDIRKLIGTNSMTMC